MNVFLCFKLVRHVQESEHYDEDIFWLEENVEQEGYVKKL